MILTLGGEATVGPGHPPVILEPMHTHDEHGRSNTRMIFSIHTGTHVGVPYHSFSDGLTVDKFPLERLMKTAVKIDIKHVDAGLLQSRFTMTKQMQSYAKNDI